MDGIALIECLRAPMAGVKHCHILTFFGPMLRTHGGAVAWLISCLGFRTAGFAQFNHRNEASSRNMKRKLIAFLLAVAPFSLAQAQQQLAGEDLQRAVAGKTVYVDTPLGEVPIRYSTNGSVMRADRTRAARRRVDHDGSRPLVGRASRSFACSGGIGGRQGALLHDAPLEPDGCALAPRRRQERHRAARVAQSSATPLTLTLSPWERESGRSR